MTNWVLRVWENVGHNGKYFLFLYGIDRWHDKFSLSRFLNRLTHWAEPDSCEILITGVAMWPTPQAQSFMRNSSWYFYCLQSPFTDGNENYFSSVLCLKSGRFKCSKNLPRFNFKTYYHFRIQKEKLLRPAHNIDKHFPSYAIGVHTCSDSQSLCY